MEFLKGATDVSTYVFMVDATAGTPETGLTIANMDATYSRVLEASVKNDLTALAAVTTAHTDNRAIEVDATNAPGLYRIDWPDAAFASAAGVKMLTLTVTCSGCQPAHLQAKLVNFNDQDGVRLGLTALPNAAADAAGGLIISDAGGLDADAQRADVAAILVDTAEIGAAGAGLTAIDLPNQTMNITGNITGNLTGSVGSVTGAAGSVTGAVGSVTGNVGGNVTGTVGSVVGAVGSVTGNVGGNVTGTVGSVVGAVGSVTGAVGSVTGLTASDVGAIKTQTDKFVFTVANEVNANIQSVNNVTVLGDGAGTPWGP